MENPEEKIENGAVDVLNALARQLRAMWIVIILLIIMLVGSNMAWLYVFQSYDYVSQDGEGQNYFNREVGGDVYNGAENQSKKERQIEGN